ncbi:D-sedoheptulose 7-phosphate isomerase [Nitrososphaera sp.]|uniref:D-sedoheptulose-7-phosphate isomerase n=1 Tax=Nitrososphaera sp. TaxID=1971748 RepID=UPI00307ECCAC
MGSFIVGEIEESIRTKTLLKAHEYEIEKAAKMMISSIGKGGKIMFCGNGGSAADSQHIAAELVGKFLSKERRALPAIALTTNTSILTAIANDFSYEDVFERQVRALALVNDVVVGISTSGKSKNVIRAVMAAKQMGCKTAALTGSSGGELAALADVCIKVPSDNTQRIQECHILIGHILCGLVEDSITNASS